MCSSDLISLTRLSEMFDIAIQMLTDSKMSFESEDTRLARGVFKKDDKLDEINGNANSVIETYIKNHPDKIQQSLHIISSIRKLERTGDQVKNVAEEIIFFIEAKVLKHVSAEKKDA